METLKPVPNMAEEEALWRKKQDEYIQRGVPICAVFAEPPIIPISGLYLSLFNGRSGRDFHIEDQSDQSLHDNGCDGMAGPIIGPIGSIASVFGDRLMFSWDSELTEGQQRALNALYNLDPFEPVYDPELNEFPVVEGLVYHDGFYYGEWELFYCEANVVPEGVSS